MKLPVVLAMLTFAAIGLWFIPQTARDRELWPGGAIVIEAVGTSGANAGETPAGAIATDAGPARGPAIIADIETITGTNDGMSLIGRRVDLHVEVQEVANDRAFWVGPPDNRVLVVLGRDNRAGVQRRREIRADHHISPVHDGQRAAVSGVIRPLPSAEEMARWNLTTADRKELADRKIYIRAERVGTENHGSF